MRRRKRTREGAARRRCSISRLLFPFSLPHFLAVLSRSPFSSTLQKRRRRRQRQKDGTTPLHLAAIRGNAPAVAALLAAPGVSVSCSSPAHPHSLRTPLHEAAASGSAECARLLLKAGADPRAQDARGKTPASVALDAGNSKLAVELAEGIRGSTGAGAGVRATGFFIALSSCQVAPTAFRSPARTGDGLPGSSPPQSR